MWSKLVDLFDNLSDSMPTFCAILICVIITLFGLGLGFGLTVVFAWIVMKVYNVLASTFDWPTFSIWFWVGAIYVIGWLKKCISITVKKED